MQHIKQQKQNQEVMTNTEISRGGSRSVPNTITSTNKNTNTNTNNHTTINTGNKTTRTNSPQVVKGETQQKRQRHHSHSHQKTVDTNMDTTMENTDIHIDNYRQEDEQAVLQRQQSGNDRDNSDDNGNGNGHMDGSTNHSDSTSASTSASTSSSCSSSSRASSRANTPSNLESDASSSSVSASSSLQTTSIKAPPTNVATSSSSSTAKTTIVNTTTTSPTIANIPPLRKDVPVESLLPSYLDGFVQYSHDDFFVSSYFEPLLIAQLMCEGFLPISTSRYLLPKLHEERCVIYPLQQQQNQKDQKQKQQQQQQQQPKQKNQLHKKQKNQKEQNNKPQSCIHVSKSTKKKLKRFTFSINQDFDGVVAGCHKQHGIAWLYPQIVASFKFMHEKTKISTKMDTTSDSNVSGNGHPGSNGDSNIKHEHKNQQTQRRQQGRGIAARLIPSQNVCQVKLYSIEVWNQQTGKLVGGELGYSIGTIYTSLTGFSNEDSAGSVQLATLGKILSLSGYEMWDLGMSLDYKLKLGAKGMKRIDFIHCVKEMRVKSPCDVRSDGVELSCEEKLNCKDIFDMDEWKC
jgi:Leu/Phe-tRNA-protein transferase